MRRIIVFALSLALVAASAAARVTRVEVTSRKDIWRGRYELLAGRVFFALDPADPHDAVIVDLDKAPRNAAGEVEFSSDFTVMRPKAGGNDALFFDVVNRGGSSFLEDNDEPSEPFLLDRGYTIAWCGWQFDVPPAAGKARLDAPIARGVGGNVRSDFVVSEKSDRYPVSHVIVGSVGGTGYPAADLSARGATLTERDSQLGVRHTIARKRWRFVDRFTIELDGGFLPGRIYEVIYPSNDPAVVGAGLAAVRDFVSWCKHDPQALAPVKIAYGFGISQSGRFLRHFVWQGFNADEKGRQVFDGMLVHVAGAGRGNFNHRFAQPSRDAEPLTPTQYPVDVFPFTDLPETDPATHVTAGLLDRAASEHVVPKIFYTNTEYEYWSRGESLTHTTPDGRDAEIPATSRIYFIPGLAHIGGPWPPVRGTAGELRTTQLRNPNRYWTVTHALIDDMEAWVRNGTEPPASQIPHIADGTLVPRSALRVQEIDGVPFPQPYAPPIVDYGREFSRGIVREPPHLLGTWPVLLPQVDGDGNALGGVRHPYVDVPVATYTGWNLRVPSIGFDGIRTAFAGSYFPWPGGKLRERYASPVQYLGLFTDAALRMMDARFLLAEDFPDLIRSGAARWAFAAK